MSLNSTGIPILLDRHTNQAINTVIPYPFWQNKNNQTNSFDESWLQALLIEHPELLPTGEISPIFSNLISIGREIGVKSGNIDDLFISAEGCLVIVETKLFSNSESRREVIAQVLNYGIDIANWTYPQLDELYRKHHNGASIFSSMVKAGYRADYEESDFIYHTNKNLQESNFLLMIVGDGIRTSAQDIAEFLNSNLSKGFQIALCKTEVYDCGNMRLVVPKLLTKTEIVERIVVQTNSQKNNEIETVVIHPAASKVPSSYIAKRYPKEDFLDIEEWIQRNAKPDITSNDIRGLLDNFKKIGIRPDCATKDMNLWYYFGESRVSLMKILGINKAENGVATPILQPSTIYKFLEQHGYDRKIGETLMESMRQFLDERQAFKQGRTPYQDEHGYYSISLPTLVNHQDEIIQNLNDFIMEVEHLQQP